MQPPAFWANRPDAPGLTARTLTPLSLIWKAATARRLARGAWARVGIPVICVGNLTVGGTGKTPTVSAIQQRLTDMGVKAHALSRGYGGSLQGPVRVDPVVHTAAQVGDEPMLLSAFGPAWIAADRLAGARAIAAAGADAIIMDDGFQNPALAKDLSIVVVDAAGGFGNGLCMPAGPLREPVDTGLARADIVLAIGPAPARRSLIAEWPQMKAKTLLEGELRPLATGMSWAGLRCLAFAGIGRPKKFFDTLRMLGADIAATRSFPDHATYSTPILQRLKAEADKLGAQLVTTEKDAVRLPDAIRRQVLTLPVRLELEDWRPLDAALRQLVKADGDRA